MLMSAKDAAVFPGPTSFEWKQIPDMTRAIFFCVAALAWGPAPAAAAISAGAPMVSEAQPAGQEGAPAQAAPISDDQAQADGQLEARLLATYDRIPGLADVEIRVEAGVVFLSGTVLSYGDRALADSLASKAPGVVYVQNGIVEETSIRVRIAPLLATAESKLLTWASYLPLLLLAGAVVLLFFFLGRMVYRWDAPFTRVIENLFLRSLARQTAAWAVGLLGVLLALELLDATALVGAVLGAAGVMGIAVGFAFRNIAENYLAGIILSLRQPFAPNDHVLIEGQEGKVLRLTSRETLLMTLDGNHLRIPNATIFNSVVQNYTRNPLRRFRFDLTIGQDEDMAPALELGRRTLEAMEGVLNDPPPHASLVEVGDSWVLLRFFGWVDQRVVALDKARSGAIRLTKEAFDRAGISMPAPEYGIRLLDGAEGGKLQVAVAERGEGPSTPPAAGPEAKAPEARAPEPGGAPAPTSSALEDLGPDRALDEQIARDREEAGETDLLSSSGRTPA
jgi:small-conductance mechanosensitive channel